MGILRAVEESLTRANNAFILIWVLTAFVLVTAFIDYRTYNREYASNENALNFYTGFQNDISRLAKKLRTNIYSDPDYTNEKQGIDALRKSRTESLTNNKWLENNIRKKQFGLSREEREVIIQVRNYVQDLLVLNSGFDDHTAEALPEEPKLQFAEHDAGSYLVADKIIELRVEDAVRYLWVSTLHLQEWNKVISELTKTSEKRKHLTGLGDKLLKIKNKIQSKINRENRKVASDIWVRWLKSVPPAENNEGREERRRSALTISQVSESLKRAEEKKTQLKIRASGEASTVTIPAISYPLQLRDAVFLLPWIMALLATTLLIHLARADTYIKRIKDKDIIISKLPIFCILFDFSKYNEYFGWVIVGITMLSPYIILIIILYFIPNITISWSWETAIYLTGAHISLCTLTMGAFYANKIYKTSHKQT